MLTDFLFPQGRNCEIPINACISLPCVNGGTCHVTPGLDGQYRYIQTCTNDILLAIELWHCWTCGLKCWVLVQHKSECSLHSVSTIAMNTSVKNDINNTLKCTSGQNLCIKKFKACNAPGHFKEARDRRIVVMHNKCPPCPINHAATLVMSR